MECVSQQNTEQLAHPKSGRGAGRQAPRMRTPMLAPLAWRARPRDSRGVAAHFAFALPPWLQPLSLCTCRVVWCPRPGDTVPR